jgi:CBS domain containing-hemolysin-like protein
MNDNEESEAQRRWRQREKLHGRQMSLIDREGYLRILGISATAKNLGWAAAALLVCAGSVAAVVAFHAHIVPVLVAGAVAVGGLAIGAYFIRRAIRYFNRVGNDLIKTRQAATRTMWRQEQDRRFWRKWLGL